MVLFTKDGCELCRIFAKTLEEVAKKFESVRGLDFTILDLSKNDMDLDIRYFPHVHFYRASNKEVPVEYDYGTDAEDVVKFLKTWATVELFPEFGTEDL